MMTSHGIKMRKIKMVCLMTSKKGSLKAVKIYSNTKNESMTFTLD